MLVINVCGDYSSVLAENFVEDALKPILVALNVNANGDDEVDLNAADAGGNEYLFY